MSQAALGPFSRFHETLRCVACHHRYAITDVRYHCSCGALLEVTRDSAAFAALTATVRSDRALSQEPEDQSGVWCFREVVLDLPPAAIVAHPEGRTRLYRRQALADFAGVGDLSFKHEGENPTGSFKDRGMTVAISMAKHLGRQRVACASTGNTSAALAAYAAHAGLEPIVFIPAGKIATGKLAQALGYGARCLAIRGDFDTAMNLVQQAADQLGLYLVNSLNPFRLEGQKTIIFELLEQMGGTPPDWIVVPAGNLGNTSAFGKALREAHAAGWIDRLPRLAAIQASGASPFATAFADGFRELRPVQAETVATAIRIGDPVNYPKAVHAIRDTRGVVAAVSDQEIMTAKAAIDRAGVGCEPASAASLAGIKKLREQGVISASERVVGILTGNMLKDTDAVLAHAGPASRVVTEIDATLAAVERALRSKGL